MNPAKAALRKIAPEASRAKGTLQIKVQNPRAEQIPHPRTQRQGAVSEIAGT
jgi:hypothetical protein